MHRPSREEYDQAVNEAVPPQGALILPNQEEKVILTVPWEGWGHIVELHDQTVEVQWVVLVDEGEPEYLLGRFTWPAFDLCLRTRLKLPDYEEVVQYIANGITVAVGPCPTMVLLLPRADLTPLQAMYPPEMNLFKKWSPYEDS